MTCPKYTTRTTPENMVERFWSKVDKSLGALACWLWLAGLNNKGYGQFCPGRQGRIYAHRLAYELTHGPIPHGLEVCHKCDNPRCVNPAHLFLGTHLDNVRDMTEKKRVQAGDRHWSHRRADLVTRGEQQWLARLTAEQVAEIRAADAAGARRMELARAYNVSRGAIYSIVKRLTWKHVP